jgi:TIR domain
MSRTMVSRQRPGNLLYRRPHFRISSGAPLVIAISYRREDSLPIAGRLYDRLQAKFGRQNVFMDFDSIPAGVDFREHIKQTIERSDLVIAVIGPRWLGEQSDSSRRIDDSNDFVRLEIKYALEQNVPVIPLLVDETLMPKSEKLPAEIEQLAFRNALPLDSGLDFHNHVDRVINGISGFVGSSGLQPDGTAGAKQSATKKPKARMRVLVAVALLVVAAAIASWSSGFFKSFGKLRSVFKSTSASATQRVLPDQFVVHISPIYKGMIHVKDDDSGSGTPLTISFAVDRKAGTMTQTSKSGDTVVKFNGVWDGVTFRGVTDAIVTKPENTQWRPESFELRFADDWKRAWYECSNEGKLYTAELSPQ